ncbi:MAG: hypothetical protein PVF33_06180 [Candidatus Latescibacterota bacterium]|jgi:hypothetical protein
MAKNLSTRATRVEDFEADLINTVETDRSRGCDPTVIAEKARSYADAVRSLLVDAAADPADGIQARFDRAMPRLESAYAGWKAVNKALEDTFQLAYVNSIPRQNLLLDQIQADLVESVGEPLSEQYIQVKALWRSHLDDHPWDAYREPASTHLDSQSLDDSLNALVRGDDLDVEDALNGLTGKLRHAFIDFIKSHPDSVVDLEPGMWKRPEIVIAGDYWVRGRRSRVVDILQERSSPRFARAFTTLQSFFTLDRGAGNTPQAIAEEMNRIPIDHRERFYRCLMLHPDYEMRRYAAGNSRMSSMWKALTPANVPCATILSLLEHIAGSSAYTNGQRKLFFDTVYRRLMNVTTRSDVLYARGIVRILTRLNFFLEDEYFARLMTLLDYLEAKESLFKIDDSTMCQYTDALKREKQRVGNVETILPDFDDVPLVILRKLARDGHFWELLAMHPIVKIAKETVPHISSRERATIIACNHRVNQEVLRAVGKRRSLFPSLRAKLTLLGNPRTPPGVSMEYLTDLGKKDIERLLRQPGIHPELRTMLRNQFNQRKR